VPLREEPSPSRGRPIRFTIVADGTALEVEASVGKAGSPLYLEPDALRSALGYELKTEGICKGELCIPTASRPGLVTGAGVDLAALADLLERPIALDVAEGIALLGESADRRSRQLRSLEAPDFRLPDLDGNEHALSDFRGRKVFLLAFASW
jgi:hypothetical protein